MSSYSVKYIAESFVNKYYEILSQSPVDLHKFYWGDASFGFVDNQLDSETVQGVDQIRQRVSQLPFRDAVISLTHGGIDFQKSDAHILVVATGTFAANGQLPRPFVNTFILVSPGQSNAYFVINSVFRLLSNQLFSECKPQLISEPNVPSSSEVATDLPMAVPEASSPITTSEDLPKENTAKQIVEPPGSTDSISSPQNETASEDIKEGSEICNYKSEAEVEVEAVTEVANSSQPTTIVEPEVEPETSKGAKSYSDIVRKLAASKGADNQPQKPVVRTVKVSPPAAPQTAVNEPSGELANKTPNPQYYAVYVNSLPENVREDELAKTFSIFGKVMQVDLARGKKYGFVKFDTEAAMQAALDYEDTLELNGSQLQIEVKTSSKNSKGSNTKPRDFKGDKDKFSKAKQNGDLRKPKRELSDKEKTGSNAKGSNKDSTAAIKK